MARMLMFLVFMFAFVFSFGFIAGYFLDRSSIIYTQNEMDSLKNEIESMQLQELFVSAGGTADCRLIYSAMGKTSYDLYDLVNRLKQTPPESREFLNLKSEADLLSAKAWLTAKRVKSLCSADIVPILFVYSGNCTGCDGQNAALQELKVRHNNTLVYAIDADLNEPVVSLIKASYDIGGPPAMIIGSEVYGVLDLAGLENVTCQQTACVAV